MVRPNDTVSPANAVTRVRFARLLLELFMLHDKPSRGAIDLRIMSDRSFSYLDALMSGSRVRIRSRAKKHRSLL